MTQKSLFWNGATVGDADTYAPYHLSNEEEVSPFVDVFLRALLDGDGNRGVLKNWRSDLAVSGVVTPVTVAAGGAVIYGMPYENTAGVNVAIPSPTTATRVDRIVLRRDWEAQTVRITRIVGTEGGSAPAITQSPAPDGSGIYDIPLAQVSITTGGAITVTDEREYCAYSLTVLNNTFGTTDLVNESVTLELRPSRTKRVFIGGGDLQPSPVSSRFDYYLYPNELDSDNLNNERLSTWGSTNASEEGWQSSWSGANQDTMLYGEWMIPADWAGGGIQTFVWWMDDTAGAAMAFYVRLMYQMFEDGEDCVYSGTYSSDVVSYTRATGWVTRSGGLTIPESQIAVGNLLRFAADVFNSAFAAGEIALILGVEFVYTGYM